MFESLLSKKIIKTMDPNLYQKLSAYRKSQLWNNINKANRGLEDGCRWRWIREFSIHWYEQSFWLAAPALTIQKLKSYSFSGASQNLIRFFLSVEETESNYMRCKVHGRNKKGGVHKAPPAGLYSGTCSKMISHYIDSLLIYLCMLMIIKYTLVIMKYWRPPKLLGDK